MGRAKESPEVIGSGRRSARRLGEGALPLLKPTAVARRVTVEPRARPGGALRAGLDASGPLERLRSRRGLRRRLDCAWRPLRRRLTLNGRWHPARTRGDGPLEVGVHGAVRAGGHARRFGCRVRPARRQRLHCVAEVELRHGRRQPRRRLRHCTRRLHGRAAAWRGGGVIFASINHASGHHQLRLLDPMRAESAVACLEPLTVLTQDCQALGALQHRYVGRAEGEIKRLCALFVPAILAQHFQALLCAKLGDIRRPSGPRMVHSVKSGVV